MSTSNPESTATADSTLAANVNTTSSNPTSNTTANHPEEDGHPIQFVHDDGVVPETTQDDGDGNDVRIGTISSARFNILSTMVGGGCLSLPLAFQQSGSILVAPLMLLVTGVITDFCFRLLVASAVHLHPPHLIRPGKDTFESITSVAFGSQAYVFSMGLVVAMCFFGAVGYSVLLRDMMEPVNDAIAPHSLSPWLHQNFTMFLVILLVTPFCTLRHLTALKDCGAASMTSVLILGGCIVFRSIQCNLHHDDSDDEPWYKYLTLFPESWRELLDAVPLYISCFVCHYNILPVHNELKEPTPTRVSWWLRSTLLFSCTIYMIIGFAGAAYAKCTPHHQVHGNILLDFDENDPLLMVGRMCLAVTITLAFPMLVIPARDIILRSLILPKMVRSSTTTEGDTAVNPNRTSTEELQEPLLSDEDPQPNTTMENDAGTPTAPTVASAPVLVLLSTSIVIFWSAGALASSVSSIDIVWDLLGSSLSILLSYLIPAGTYLVITRKDTSQQQPYTRREYWSRILCWLLLAFFFPLMIVSTANAVANTFFE